MQLGMRTFVSSVGRVAVDAGFQLVALFYRWPGLFRAVHQSGQLDDIPLLHGPHRVRP